MCCTPPPVRCDYCPWLFEGVVRPQTLDMRQRMRQKEAAPEAAGGGGASPGTIGSTRNDLLTLAELLHVSAFVERWRQRFHP